MHSDTITLVSVCILLIAGNGCTDYGVEPIKDPRSYTWTIDTLAYPGSFQTTMRDIWGSSPTDVYVVGHNERGFGKMFHFDGKEWKPVGLNPIEGGTIEGPIDLSAIHGFSRDNIWVVGQRIYVNPNRPPNFLDSSLVIHFDGSQWREQRIQDGRFLNTIWGLSSSNLWTGGWTNRLYHYNGATWQRDSLPVIVPPDGFFQINVIDGTRSGELFALAQTGQSSQARVTHYFFYKPEAGNWVAVDSFVVQPGQIENKWGYGDLWASPSGTLYSCGRGVHRWDGTAWTQLVDHPNFLSRMTGTSDKNIFAVGHFGTVLHFNGRDWHEYRQFANPDAVLWGVWTSDKEVVIVGHTAEFPQRTLILHGK